MSQVSGTRNVSRRQFVVGSVAGSVAISGGLIGARAQDGTPISATPITSGTPIAGTNRYLAVADPVAETLAIYQLLDLALVGALEGVAVNGHAGFIPLPDGRILFMDDLGKRLIALSVQGGELVIQDAEISGTSFSHIAVDSDHAHLAAVGSDDPAAPISLVDLETWAVTPVALLEAGEVGLFLNHEMLFHRNDVSNQIEAYALEDVLAGTVVPVSTVQIGAMGHGESISMNGNTLYTATDDGIDVVAWDGSELTYLTTYGWDSADRSGGRGYFQRLSLDGSQVVSYTADRSAPETEWTTWTNDAVLIGTADGETQRTELGTGYVFRFGLAPETALFYRIAEEGDEAVVLDLATGEVSQRIALPAMSGGPQAGTSIYETNQYRAMTSSPDGKWGFVTQGGDGLVQVLDLAAGVISGVIEVGSALDGGGYLGFFGGEDAFVDTIGR